MKAGRDRFTIAAGIAVALLGMPTSLAAQAHLALAQLSAGSIWLPLLVVVGASAAGVFYWRRQQGSHRRRTREGVPPLLFPAAPATADRKPRREPAPFGRMMAAEAPVPAMAGVSSAMQAAAATASAPPPFPVSLGEASGGTVVEGHTIRFHQPPDGTLQILPGRLDIVEGAESGHSIRFVRTPGAPEITFGRSEGPAYKHIQLRAPTVSRKHAQMRFDGTGWSIINLSQTNPVVVNGDELASGDACELAEGDRIEMGEVVFVFRER